MTSCATKGRCPQAASNGMQHRASPLISYLLPLVHRSVTQRAIADCVSGTHSLLRQGPAGQSNAQTAQHKYLKGLFARRRTHRDGDI